jgi:hypothetical protein
MTPSGIEPATFRLVAQYRVPVYRAFVYLRFPERIQDSQQFGTFNSKLSLLYRGFRYFQTFLWITFPVYIRGLIGVICTHIQQANKVLRSVPTHHRHHNHHRYVLLLSYCIKVWDAFLCRDASSKGRMFMKGWQIYEYTAVI